jgi:DNA (cytosine-5)-methyltransferase 1
VIGSPLINPVLLCGCMFGLGTYRHRLVESNFYVTPPNHPAHEAATTKMGRKPKDGEFMHVVGNFSGIAKARKAMGIDWMTRDEIREAIPPAYGEFIGRAAIQHIQRARAA